MGSSIMGNLEMKRRTLALLAMGGLVTACSPLKDASGKKLSAAERSALQTCDSAYHHHTDNPFDPVWASDTTFSTLPNGHQSLTWSAAKGLVHTCDTSSDGARYMGGLS